MHRQQVVAAVEVDDVLEHRVLQVRPEDPPVVLVEQQRGRDGRGVDGVDPDQVGRQLHREGAHEPDDPVLGRGVGGEPGCGLERQRGADEQDGPALALIEQVRDRSPGGVPHGGEVRVQHGPPVLLAGLRRAGGDALDAGVGRDDVHPAELADSVGQQPGDGVEVAGVGLGGDDPAILFLDQRDGHGEVLLGGRRSALRLHRAAHVERDDVRALLGEPHGMDAALAARRAGDERDLARDPAGHAYTGARSKKTR